MTYEGCDDDFCTFLQKNLPSFDKILEVVELSLPKPIVGDCTLFLITKTYSEIQNENYDIARNKSEELLDYTWEKLNTGYWKDVALEWRILYSHACLCNAISLYMVSQGMLLEKVIKVCDMGLLMGSPIFDGIFHKMVKLFHIQEPTIDAKCIEEVCTNSEHLKNDSNKIPVIHCPSISEFQTQYMVKNEPVILEGCIDHWPALSKWSNQYLSQIAGRRLVPVEIGSKYTNEKWGQKLMTINEFIANFLECKTLTNVGYLAQHQLFEQIPQLQKDFMMPDYCFISDNISFDEDNIDINAWFGPKGTISPCHYDPKHNLLCQVRGSKYIKLYYPSCSPALYPYPEGNMLHNTSQVDVESPDVERFPLFENMDKGLTQEHILKKGQILYIPPKHWHYIRSLEQSYSVSFWWE